MRILVLLAVVMGAGCSSDAVDSNEQARRAYLGLDPSIGKSLTLGFDGFNAASNANIPPQSTTGTKSGTLGIAGHVDAGTSSNKTMHLTVAMVTYSDGPVEYDSNHDTVTVTYDTSTDVTMQPLLGLTLANFPNGTYTGSVVGTYHLSGDLAGDVDLDVNMSGQTMDDGTGKTIRTPGTTTITGTATDGDGMFTVNVTL